MKSRVASDILGDAMIFSIILFVVVIFALSIFYSTIIRIQKYTFYSSFNTDLHFVLISDYHSNPFISLPSLNRKIKRINPEMIVLLGDITDRHDKDLTKTRIFLEKLEELHIPTYYVLGNHERYRQDCQKIQGLYKKYGISHIGEEVTLEEQKKGLSIYGFDYDGILRCKEKEGKLHILFTHSYENFRKYSHENVDFIFSGHTHGGQIRLPFLGQILGHGPTFFPKYSKGVYKISKDQILCITSGLGNSSFPLRLFNFVEIADIKIRNRH